MKEYSESLQSDIMLSRSAHTSALQEVRFRGNSGECVYDEFVRKGYFILEYDYRTYDIVRQSRNICRSSAAAEYVRAVCGRFSPSDAAKHQKSRNIYVVEKLTDISASSQGGRPDTTHRTSGRGRLSGRQRPTQFEPPSTTECTVLWACGAS